MICQACGVVAPTKYVAFHQNIGMLVMRHSRSIEGHLCKSCIHENFWNYTLITLVLGWWGIISLIVTPFILLNNIVRYVLCLRMAIAPSGIGGRLADATILGVHPFTQQIRERLSRGEDLVHVAKSIGSQANVSTEQVLLYISSMMNEESTTS